MLMMYTVSIPVEIRSTKVFTFMAESREEALQEALKFIHEEQRDGESWTIHEEDAVITTTTIGRRVR